MSYEIHLPIKESATLRFNALAGERKKQGLPVFNLSAGEPMVPPHPRIIEAASHAMQTGKTLYTPAAGILELRQAFIGWLNKNHQTNLGVENIVITAGGKFALFALFQLVLRPGNEVLIPAPYWTSYTEMVKMFGGVPKIISTSANHGWKITATDLEKHITPQTKILIINNGSNPTGILYTRSELKAIVAKASEKGLLVVSDEVYSGLTFDGAEFVSVLEFLEYSANTVVIQSASKHFAMTGWRVGAAVGPVDLIKAITTLQTQSTSGAAGVSQYAALGAIEHSDEVNGSVLKEMQKRRDIFVETFNKLFTAQITAPQVGLYCFFPLSAIGLDEKDDVAGCEKILAQTGVALVPGSAFGVPGFTRASFGAKPEQFVEGLKKLKEYLG